MTPITIQLVPTRPQSKKTDDFHDSGFWNRPFYKYEKLFSCALPCSVGRSSKVTRAAAVRSLAHVNVCHCPPLSSYPYHGSWENSRTLTYSLKRPSFSCLTHFYKRKWHWTLLMQMVGFSFMLERGNWWFKKYDWPFCLKTDPCSILLFCDNVTMEFSGQV